MHRQRNWLRSTDRCVRRACRSHGLETGGTRVNVWGNPVCIAAALKTIELLEGGLVKNSAEVGAYLKAGLEKLQKKYDCIGDVRGMGMMIGVEFVEDRSFDEAGSADLRDRIEVACFDRGLIILGCGNNAIRWSPPLILTKENVDVALEIFDEAIKASL